MIVLMVYEAYIMRSDTSLPFIVLVYEQTMTVVSDYSRPKLKTSDIGSEFRFCLNSNFGNGLNF